MEGSGVMATAGGPEAPCDGKRVYKSEQAARVKVREMRKRVIDPHRLNVYLCARHNGWHVGNTTGRAMRALLRSR
jgi:hypothetical protein